MYSTNVQHLLQDHDIEIGDRITVHTDTGKREGRLMPRAEQGNTDALVLKLDNGYNLGINHSNIHDIEKTGSNDSPDRDREQPPEPDPDNPDITILHTGGTIASRVSYAEGGVKPAFDPEDLLEMYPELFDRANIESHVIAQMLSEDMEPEHWQEIAQAVADHRDCDGIIIGHGTDTMQYTAAALSYMLENIDIPVILVGAQRSSDRPSSDAAMNLLSAVAFINEDIPGVYVCMHAAMSDTTAHIHQGTRVRKMHTSRRDAFQSIGTQPVAAVDYTTDEVDVQREPSTPDDDFRLRDELDTEAELVKTTPGMDPALLNGLSDKHGIIIEGTGLGHMPVNSFDDHTQHHEQTLQKVRDLADDTLIAMTSQCINGRVNMNVYDAGVKLQKAGITPSASMTPTAAYVKLMWALGQEDSIDEARDLYTTDIAGEILKREEHDDYREGR